MSERELFEESAARMGYNLTMAEHETGEYRYPVTQDAWNMWQECCDKAARQAPAKVPEGFEVMRRPEGIMVTRLSDGGSAFYEKESPLVTQVMAYHFLDALLTTPAPATTPETEWVKLSEDQPREVDVDVKLNDGSIIRNCLAQSDGDFYWKGGWSEMFILEHTVFAWRSATPPQEQ